MSLWVDKYRPTKINDLAFHPEISQKLKLLADCNDLPHLLVFGPTGAGKKTRINSLLNEIFDSSVEKIKISTRSFQTPSGRKIDINVISSNYHMEINPSEVGIYDRVVIQELIKETAQTHQVSAQSKCPYKCIVLHEADSLSRDAQHALRRTMEKYMGNLRMIVCCNSTGRIIQPIRSRCLHIRIPAPKLEEIATLLQKVAVSENFSVPDSLLKSLAQDCNGNARRALLMLEALHVQPISASHADQKWVVPKTDWEAVIEQLAKDLLQSQSATTIQKARSVLYDLLAHCIPPTLILKRLTFLLIDKIDDDLKSTVVRHAAFYEARMVKGQKPIFHLEAFVAKFQSVYKRFLIDIDMA